MKNLLLFFAIIFSTNMFCQVPDDFNIITVNDVDSAVVLLSKAAKQQYKKIPIKIEITKDYISQNRQVGKGNMMTWDKRTVEVPKLSYFETITKVYVKKGWEIHFQSKTTGIGDYIIVKDKKTAESVYSALICLIKFSGNTNFDSIVNPPKRK